MAGEAEMVFCGPRDPVQGATVIGEDFGLVVIDEAFWQDGISGVAAKSRLVIDSLADELKDAPVRDYYGNTEPAGGFLGFGFCGITSCGPIGGGPRLNVHGLAGIERRRRYN